MTTNVRLHHVTILHVRQALQALECGSFVSDKSMFAKFASSSSIAVATSGQTYEIQFRSEARRRRGNATTSSWGT
jgi:hypothetical protein